MNKLKSLRAERNLTREALSRVTGIKTRTIKHWEDGTVSLEKAAYISIMKLAKALEIEPSDLFGGDPNDK